MKRVYIACLIKNILFAAACIVAVVSVMVKSVPVASGLLYGAAGALVLGIIVSVCFFRCPYCKRALAKGARTPDVCPHCGEKLR